MKKFFLTAVVILLSVVSANAQSLRLGARAGYNYSKFIGKSVSDLDLKAKNGYHVGLFAELPFSAKFSIQLEVLYSVQGAGDVFQKDDELNTKNINIPILFKYYIIDGLNLQFGPQVSFNTDSEYKFNKDGANKLWKDVKVGEMTNGLNYGAVLGLGYKLPVIGISIDARYALGLNNVINAEAEGLEKALEELKSEDNLKNGVLTLGVGYQF